MRIVISLLILSQVFNCLCKETGRSNEGAGLEVKETLLGAINTSEKNSEDWKWKSPEQRPSMKSMMLLKPPPVSALLPMTQRKIQAPRLPTDKDSRMNSTEVKAHRAATPSMPRTLPQRNSSVPNRGQMLSRRPPAPPNATKSTTKIQMKPMTTSTTLTISPAPSTARILASRINGRGDDKGLPPPRIINSPIRSTKRKLPTLQNLYKSQDSRKDTPSAPSLETTQKTNPEENSMDVTTTQAPSLPTHRRKMRPRTRSSTTTEAPSNVDAQDEKEVSGNPNSYSTTIEPMVTDSIADLNSGETPSEYVLPPITSSTEPIPSSFNAKEAPGTLHSYSVSYSTAEQNIPNGPQEQKQPETPGMPPTRIVPLEMPTLQTSNFQRNSEMRNPERRKPMEQGWRTEQKTVITSVPYTISEYSRIREDNEDSHSLSPVKESFQPFRPTGSRRFQIPYHIFQSTAAPPVAAEQSPQGLEKLGDNYDLVLNKENRKYLPYQQQSVMNFHDDDSGHVEQESAPPMTYYSFDKVEYPVDSALDSEESRMHPTITRPDSTTQQYEEKVTTTESPTTVQPVRKRYRQRVRTTTTTSTTTTTTTPQPEEVPEPLPEDNRNPVDMDAEDPVRVNFNLDNPVSTDFRTQNPQLPEPGAGIGTVEIVSLNYGSPAETSVNYDSNTAQFSTTPHSVFKFPPYKTSQQRESYHMTSDSDHSTTTQPPIIAQPAGPPDNLKETLVGNSPGWTGTMVVDGSAGEEQDQDQEYALKSTEPPPPIVKPTNPPEPVKVHLPARDLIKTEHGASGKPYKTLHRQRYTTTAAPVNTPHLERKPGGRRFTTTAAPAKAEPIRTHSYENKSPEADKAPGTSWRPKSTGSKRFPVSMLTKHEASDTKTDSVETKNNTEQLQSQAFPTRNPESSYIPAKIAVTTQKLTVNPAILNTTSINSPLPTPAGTPQFNQRPSVPDFIPKFVENTAVTDYVIRDNKNHENNHNAPAPQLYSPPAVRPGPVQMPFPQTPPPRPSTFKFPAPFSNTNEQGRPSLPGNIQKQPEPPRTQPAAPFTTSPGGFTISFSTLPDGETVYHQGPQAIGYQPEQTTELRENRPVPPQAPQHSLIGAAPQPFSPIQQVSSENFNLPQPTRLQIPPAQTGPQNNEDHQQGSKVSPSRPSLQQYRNPLRPGLDNRPNPDNKPVLPTLPSQPNNQMLQHPQLPQQPGRYQQNPQPAMQQQQFQQSPPQLQQFRPHQKFQPQPIQPQHQQSPQQAIQHQQFPKPLNQRQQLHQQPAQQQPVQEEMSLTQSIIQRLKNSMRMSRSMNLSASTPDEQQSGSEVLKAEESQVNEIETAASNIHPVVEDFKPIAEAILDTIQMETTAASDNQGTENRKENDIVVDQTEGKSLTPTTGSADNFNKLMPLPQVLEEPQSAIIITNTIPSDGVQGSNAEDIIVEKIQNDIYQNKAEESVKKMGDNVEKIADNIQQNIIAESNIPSRFKAPETMEKGFIPVTLLTGS